ncbi:hypothetical protein [Nostoc commune]|uniref:hypothetical protein n=1 Tax=Nostoc commune TaxID=1178 RepID=UPI0018C4A367|nr:hypothetical protein [Nostoc commune]MBG1258869.1 hypothetical protein [Nostoc commune BAE]
MNQLTYNLNMDACTKSLILLGKMESDRLHVVLAKLAFSFWVYLGELVSCSIAEIRATTANKSLLICH